MKSLELIHLSVFPKPCLVEPLWFPLVKKFYQAYYPNGKPNKADPIWALKQGSTIFACFRLRPISDDVQLLTAMVTHPEFRGQGYGKHLLLATHTILSSKASYCFANPNLVPFYQKMGFEIVTDEQLPEQLVDRLKKYRTKQPKLRALQYNAIAPSH